MSFVSISRPGGGTSSSLVSTGNGLSVTAPSVVVVPTPSMGFAVLLVDYLGAVAATTVTAPVASGSITVT